MDSTLPDNIRFSTAPGQDLQQIIQSGKYSSVAVVADTNTARHCYPLIEKSLPAHTLITIQAGEEHKDLRTAATIWEKMTEAQMDRHGILIVLGGGVLGDMGGFCAATYKRGIDFVLTPTTLLSQVDASIGGKLGIDFQNYKNHIGVFQLPAYTLLSESFLQTLPENELRSGFAEIIKHTLISDREKWEEISSKSLAAQNWNDLIRHSVKFKSKVITEDPKEKGLRKILNAGHTIGHAIETWLLSENRKVMHGEAIAAGLIAEGYLAKERKLLSPQDLEAITRFILGVFGKIDLGKEDDDKIARLTLQDKKNKGKRILCVLLNGIGKAGFDYEITVEEVKQALMFYRSVQM